MSDYQSVYYDAQGRPYIALSLPLPDYYEQESDLKKKDVNPPPERGVIIIDMFSDE